VRAFVAVTLPGGAAEGSPSTAAATGHLTLRFLGDVTEGTVEALTRALAPAVARTAPFEFVVEGLGAFPGVDRPRVVWRGVTRGVAELRALARVVREVVESVGVAPDRTPFVPHVTLFRVRSPRDRERAALLFRTEAGDRPPEVVRVTSVELVESRLEPAGAIHRTIARFPLAGSEG
jgi:2'-5' RNA ligase